MALYTTFNRNTTEAEQLRILTGLAKNFQNKLSMRKPKIIITGYLDAAANEDTVFEEIERDHMKKLFTSISNSLTQMGVPSNNIYIWDPVFSYIKGHQHRIDIFLQQEGESGTVFPSNPPQDPAHPRTKKPEPATVELSIDQTKKFAIEGVVWKKEFGARIPVTDIKIKKSVSISPEGVSIEGGLDLTVIKKDLAELVKKPGSFIEGIEIEMKLVGAAEIKRSWEKEIEKAISAKFETAFTRKLGSSGIGNRLSIQVFMSFGGEYGGSKIEPKAEGGIKLIGEFEFGGG